MAKELPKNYDFKAVEEKLIDYWHNKAKIFVFDKSKKAPIFSIDTPPPTVSGKLHMGHAFSYSHFDFIARYKRMRGFNVLMPWGFDDNGLATERLSEKETGKSIHEVGRQEFVNLCLEVTKKYEKILEEDAKRIGLSADFEHAYRTIEPKVQKIAQWSFIDLYEKGLAYRKESPTLWCPQCRTAIAQAELEDKEFESTFNKINFELEDGGTITIATTRPELIPACVAIMVNPEDDRYKDLIGKKVKVPFSDRTVEIIADSRVSIEKGTGAVMCCTFGDLTDIDWWKAYNLPLRLIFNPDGTLNELAGKYHGMKIKEARKKILEDLREEGKLVESKPIIHTVNVHERCGTEIEFLITKQWYIKVLDRKLEFLERVNEIEWKPNHMKSRIVNWINGLQWDWCISRQRFFGVPFPVWYCKNCGKEIVASKESLPVDPTNGGPELDICPSCGSNEFEPEKDVLDTWFTSALTPQIGAKFFEDKELYERAYPFNLRPQAHDIINFWAFYTIVKNHLHFNSKPWKTIMISGWALDPQGKKMSKSKGNVIPPMQMVEKYGADALRYWAASSKLGEDTPVKEKEFVAGFRTVKKLWNAARFASMHLADKDIKSLLSKKPEKLAIVDLALLSKLYDTLTKVTEAFDSLAYNQARRLIDSFFWEDFAENWLEVVKDRLYNGSREYWERESAHYTLALSLLTIIKMYAPIMPFVTDEIYLHLFSDTEEEKSIHVSSWPLNYFEDFEASEDLITFYETLKLLLSEVRKFKNSRQLSLKAELSKIILWPNLTIKSYYEEALSDLKAVTKAKEIVFDEVSEQGYVLKDISLEILL